MSRSQKAVVAGITAALLSVAGVAGAAGLGAFTTHVTRSHRVAVRAPQPRADRNEPARRMSRTRGSRVRTTSAWAARNAES